MRLRLVLAVLAMAGTSTPSWAHHSFAATIDAKIQNVASPRRSLVGMWAQGEKKGDFKAVRDN